MRCCCSGSGTNWAPIGGTGGFLQSDVFLVVWSRVQRRHNNASGGAGAIAAHKTAGRPSARSPAPDQERNAAAVVGGVLWAVAPSAISGAGGIGLLGVAVFALTVDGRPAG